MYKSSKRFLTDVYGYVFTVKGTIRAPINM